MTSAFLLAGLSILRFSQRSMWLYPFLVLLALNIAGMVISSISGLNKRRINLSDHVRLVETHAAARQPSVDVFLPTCGESIEVLNNTYRYVAQLDYSGTVTVWVLDDADRAEVKAAALAHGFQYLVRPDRGHMKKAGNLLYAYGQSAGELIAIFDADFCPRQDYLQHLVPYFHKNSVGIVQSPQVFDTDPATMGWLQRTAGATQELFYRWVQPSRDAANAPICVGTNAVYRRAALATIGGFAQIEHSEDVHTGIALLRQGFDTKYVPVLLAKGLCPDDLASFFNQQYRWCNGSITLLKSGVAHRRPLRMRQRMCFWSGFMYYITTALNVFTVHLPGIIMAFAFPNEVLARNFVPFMAGAWVYLVLLPRMFKSRWRFEVLRVQMAYSFSHAVAILDKLTRRSAGWVPTGAVTAGNALSRRIARIAFVWLSAATLASWVGVLRDINHFGIANFWPMTLFLMAYTYLSVPLIVDSGKILRREHRLRRAANSQFAAA